MKELSGLLFDLGIQNNFYTYQPKKVNHSGVGILFIHKKEMRKNYYKKLIIKG